MKEGKHRTGITAFNRNLEVLRKRETKVYEKVTYHWGEQNPQYLHYACVALPIELLR